MAALIAKLANPHQIEIGKDEKGPIFGPFCLF